MLEIENISKRYGQGTLANDDISLSVAAGEVFALLGPNGAGKTTLVHQIVGLMRPSSGSIHVDGVDVVQNPMQARKLCAFQPQSQIPIDGLNPKQAIELTGRIRGLSVRQARRRAEELIEKLDLGAWAKENGERLSGGIRRLTAFAMTIAAKTPVAIFDEPTNDVDPQRRRHLWQELQALADEGSAVILVTHNVLEAEKNADRLAMIHESRLIRQGTPVDFQPDAQKTMILELTLKPEAMGTELLSEHRFLKRGPRHWKSIDFSDLEAATHWASDLRQKGVCESFSITPPSLEDAYLQLIQSKCEITAREEGA